MFRKTAKKLRISDFDYKNPYLLQKFLIEGGRIAPARLTKLTYKQQKSLCLAIKRARNLALVPSGTFYYDQNKRYEPISSKPFSL